MKRIRDLMVLLGLTALCACSSEAPADRASAQPQAPATSSATPDHSRPAPPIPLQTTRPRGYRGPLPPIPSGPYAAAPPEVIQAVYEFAARRPDVLRYVPCFCGCERNGHKGNEDCFVASRDADGRPEWDAHGFS